MTQKKVVIPTVDELIERKDVPAITAEYVRLTLSANKLRDFLLADPALKGVLSGLVGHVDRGISGQVPPSWNPLLQQEQIPAPGVLEPPGTIHMDVPVTYEYPMDNYGEGNPQQAVLNLLQDMTQGEAL